MGLYQLLDDGQAQAGATRGPCSRPVWTVEPVRIVIRPSTFHPSQRMWRTCGENVGLFWNSQHSCQESVHGLCCAGSGGVGFRRPGQGSPARPGEEPPGGAFRDPTLAAYRLACGPHHGGRSGCSCPRLLRWKRGGAQCHSLSYAHAFVAHRHRHPHAQRWYTGCHGYPNPYRLHFHPRGEHSDAV
jgi:hypothetical protein